MRDAPGEGAEAPAPAEEHGDLKLPAAGLIQAVAAALGVRWLAETLRPEDLPADGLVSAPRLIDLASDIGLDIQPMRMALDAITPEKLPLIFPLAGGGALVIERVAKGRAWYRDAAQPKGLRSARVVDLGRRGIGWVATAARLPDNTEAQTPAGTGSSFWHVIVSSWPHYLVVMLAVAVTNLLGLALPLFSMALYDRVIPNAAYTTLVALGVGVVAAMLLDFIMTMLRSLIIEALGARADRRLARQVFGNLMRLQLASRPPSAGATVNDLSEVEGLRDLLTSAVPVTLMDIAFSVLFIVVIYAIAGLIALIPLAGMLLAILIALVLHLPAARLARKQRAAEAEKHSQLVETMAALEAIKIWRAEAHFRRRWGQAADTRAAITARHRLLQQANANLARLVQQGTYLAVMVVSVLAVLNGQFSAGVVIAVSMLASRAMAPATTLGSLLVRLAHGRQALRRIDAIMQLPQEAVPGSQPTLRGPAGGSVVFRNVTFSFPGQPRPALQGVTFTIADGQRVGVVGRIGSGKSSIARLIAGLYSDFSGSVLIGGLDVRQVSSQSLRRDIGYAMQDFCLIRGSLYENLTLGLPHASRDQVMEAAYVTGLDEIAALHPLGYGMPVAEHGRNLSAGVRQSVIVARALIGRPRLMVLDEPTSFMDNVAEARFVQRLRSFLAPQQTLLVLTHRSALLELTTRMIVLDGGNVVADDERDIVMRRLREGAKTTVGSGSAA